MTHEVAALDIVCPTCKAKAGEDCLTKQVNDIHSKRLKEAAGVFRLLNAEAIAKLSAGQKKTQTPALEDLLVESP